MRGPRCRRCSHLSEPVRRRDRAAAKSAGLPSQTSAASSAFSRSPNWHCLVKSRIPRIVLPRPTWGMPRQGLESWTNRRDTADRLVPDALAWTAAPTGSQPDRVAAGRQPREHLAHRQPTQDLGRAQHLIAGHGQFPAAVAGPGPRPGHRHPPTAQGHRPGLGTVPIALPVGSCRPFGPHSTLTSCENIVCIVCIVCRPAPTASASSPSLNPASIVWYLLLTVVPFLKWCLGRRPTPTARQDSGGGPPPQVLRDPGQPPRSQSVSNSNNSRSAAGTSSGITMPVTARTTVSHCRRRSTGEPAQLLMIRCLRRRYTAIGWAP